MNMGKWSLTYSYAVLTVYIIATVSLPTSPSDKMSVPQILEYFKNGQYIGVKNPDSEIASITDPEAQLISGTKTWQRMWGFQETGQLTPEQIDIMLQPRCSNPDVEKMEDMKKRRKKRFAAFSKWDHTDLTYKISVYPRDYDLTDAEVDDSIHRAFEVWTTVTPLSFRRLYGRDDKVDIDIQFGSYSHGDYYPFDGPNGYLAHAFFPPMGDTHFDDSEKWTITADSYNLFIVAVHEFGHALGLGHSPSVPTAIMYPNYRYQENLELDYDDIIGIQTLYGGKPDPDWPNDRPDIEPTTKSTTTTEATKKPDPNQPTTPYKPTIPTKKPTIPPYSPLLPKICEHPKMDAISYFEDKNDPSSTGTFGFQGEYYFKIGDHGYVDEAYPRLIREDWHGIPDNIDAALYWESTPTMPAMSLIFKDNRYWALQGKKVMEGYPKSITNFGIPTQIDAAFVWNYNGKTYFFKDFYYYRYTRNVGPDHGFPRRISTNWEGLPDGIDAAFKWDNMQTYFFKENEYYRYDDLKGTIAEYYPRPLDQVWLKCSRVKDIYNIENDNNDTGAVEAVGGGAINPHGSILTTISTVLLILSHLIL